MRAWLAPCCVLFALAGSGSALAQADRSIDAEPPPPAAPVVEGVPYDVTIAGIEDKELRTLLEESSRLLSLKDRPPRSRAGLRRRIDDDRERFDRVMRSEGYYDAKITSAIDGAATPLEVTVTIEPGPRFRLASYEIRYAPEPGPGVSLPSAPSDIELELGMPARSPTILEAERKLLRLLAEAARPLATISDRRAVIDRADNSMSVTLTVDPGPAAAFGAVRFEGLDRAEESYLQRLVPWTPGDPFDSREIAALRKALNETRLFTSLRIQRAEQLDAQGRLPVTVSASERAPRTIGLGANFSSSEGIGGEASWEHRNLFGRAESLRITGRASQIDFGGSLAFRKPNLWQLGQHLLADAELKREEFPAYNKDALGGTIRLERELSEDWTVSGGFAGELSDIEERGLTNTFTIYGLPMVARFDSSDDLLDPSRGQRLQFGLTPNIAGSGRNLRFVESELTASTYHEILSDKRAIFAARARFGAVVGEDRFDLPADRRLYAGGGGSIRGYAFQSVGPLDVSDNPQGGRSVFEIGAEVRFRVTEEIGLVPFIEAGNVYEDPLPNFDRTPLVGAGLGLRYFTAVGPLRLDLGFPLTRRRGVDEIFEFYISIGQAF